MIPHVENILIPDDDVAHLDIEEAVVAGDVLLLAVDSGHPGDAVRPNLELLHRSVFLRLLGDAKTTTAHIGGVEGDDGALAAHGERDFPADRIVPLLPLGRGEVLHVCLKIVPQGGKLQHLSPHVEAGVGSLRHEGDVLDQGLDFRAREHHLVHPRRVGRGRFETMHLPVPTVERDDAQGLAVVVGEGDQLNEAQLAFLRGDDDVGPVGAEALGPIVGRIDHNRAALFGVLQRLVPFAEANCR